MTIKQYDLITNNPVYIYIKYKTRYSHGEMLIKQVYYDNFLTKRKKKLIEETDIIKLCLMQFVEEKLIIVHCNIKEV